LDRSVARSEATVSMPDTAMPTVDSATPFSFRGHLPADVTGLRHALHEWLASCGCDRARALDVTVAVTEAAANAVVHGRSEFEVDARRDAARTVVVVRDRGRWRSRRSGGYGLTMMRALADDLGISAARDGTTVTLVFAS
jgi:anti-sigma regulatory factor (Ser/Thr protein kinase)